MLIYCTLVLVDTASKASREDKWIPSLAPCRHVNLGNNLEKRGLAVSRVPENSAATKLLQSPPSFVTSGYNGTIVMVHIDLDDD